MNVEKAEPDSASQFVVVVVAAAAAAAVVVVVVLRGIPESGRPGTGQCEYWEVAPVGG